MSDGQACRKCGKHSDSYTDTCIDCQTRDAQHSVIKLEAQTQTAQLARIIELLEINNSILADIDKSLEKLVPYS